jgi:hypothetical protein
METTETQSDEYASNELRVLIERTLAGARVPRDTRSRLSSVLETAMRENISLLRRYVRALAYNGRAAEMMEMYSEGQTLDEIGEHYEVTRERVRQILTSTFGDYRTAVPDEMRHERALRRLAERTAEWDEEYAEAITDLFNQGNGDAQIADALDIPRTKVTEFRSRRGMRHTRGVDWTDDDIFGALQRSYREIGQGLTIARYSEWRDEIGPKKVPSYLTVLIRFESFEAACDAAKVPYVGRSNAERRSDYITPEMARDHLASFLDWAMGSNKRATSGTYAEYRVDHSDAPSMAVMSRRLGGFRSALDELIASRSS